MIVSLSKLDAAITLLAILVAVAFFFVRRASGVRNPAAQWIADALNAGTLAVLLVFIVYAIARSYVALPRPLEAAVVHTAEANGIVLVLAYCNCVRAIGSGMLQSLRPEDA